MSLTTDPKDPCLNTPKGEGQQNKCYIVLSEEERAKGFIRPVRCTYIHAGRLIELEEGTLREMTQEEKKRHNKYGKIYSHFLEYPVSKLPLVGKHMTQEEVDNIGKRIGGCGTKTTMAIEIAETYARDPKFYGLTWCMNCGEHINVNEFIWDDGSNETVGS